MLLIPLVRKKYILFNFKLNHPGGGAYQAQSKEYTLETQLGFANTSAGLMYRTRLTAYY